VATARWLAEVYEPLIESIPEEIFSRLEPAEVFHSMLEHRYLMAERLSSDVSNEVALDDYLQTVLQHQPAERQLSLDDNIGLDIS
jgi:hypothetical protein